MFEANKGDLREIEVNPGLLSQNPGTIKTNLQTFKDGAGKHFWGWLEGGGAAIWITFVRLNEKLDVEAGWEMHDVGGDREKDDTWSLLVHDDQVDFAWWGHGQDGNRHAGYQEVDMDILGWTPVTAQAGGNIAPGPCDAQGRPYFLPNNPLTRGQVAKIVSNAVGFNEPVPADTWTFADVPPGSTFHDFVERLAARHIMGGYPCRP